jgi:formylglycine-generating enzyme required for sulfatase activity/class 3 adenylate cyclase
MGEILDFRSNRSGAPPRQSAPSRLAAIVAGGISGYSRLMQIDDEGTHGRVKRIERGLIEPSILEHHGTLVKTTGDGFIAIFDSPVEAARCGLAIRQGMVERNASLPKHHWIEYRIGVNLGDVSTEPNDVFGDGVNIASRLEAIAEPGQVCISGGIYEQIKHRLVCGYESLGDRKVKNITDRVTVYRVLPDPDAFHRIQRRRENILIFLLSLTLLAIASGAIWYLFGQPHRKVGEEASVAGSQETQKTSSSPPSIMKQATPLPKSSSAVTVPQVAPQAQPFPAAKQAASQSQPASPVLPATPSDKVLREPEMIAIRGSSFVMGSNDDPTEKPTRQVTIKSFAMSQHPVSVREWNECAAVKACGFVATGKDDTPVTNISWSDGKQFVGWLAGTTRKAYRLPSEAEWEYAARGGTQTKYWWGDQFQSGIANCKECNDIAAAEQPIKVGSFKPNPFGLYDMGGGVDQWVEDCWHKNYQGAPADGSAWAEGECGSHVIRSGSWKNDARYVRPSNRDSYDTNVRYPTHGFRVALSP